MKFEDLNLKDWEIVPEPVPENETPRQFLLRMTGHDFPDLEEFSWACIREDLFLWEFLTDTLTRFSKPPRIILKRKET